MPPVNVWLRKILDCFYERLVSRQATDIIEVNHWEIHEVVALVLRSLNRFHVDEDTIP